MPTPHTDVVVLSLKAIDRLFAELAEDGFTTVGPRVVDDVIRYQTISGIMDLPIGITDEQTGGHYRLRPRSDEALFGFAVGPDSARALMYPPSSAVFSFDVETGTFSASDDDPAPVAIIGLRPCELAAIAIQDRVFRDGPHPDPVYQARREQLFVVAVNCVEAGATCFCDSMGTGPSADTGYDIVLTELNEADHRFAAQAATSRGEEILRRLPSRPSTSTDLLTVAQGIDHARQSMGRTLDTENIRELLIDHPEHPAWADAASRCLACTNCTLVCPTCFCSTVIDESSFDGSVATRSRTWDSCFSLDFSYVGGAPVRSSVASRYRQWMTHKLATWHDQFGSSGCVGCGRCITWCPVGIDITAIAAEIRSTTTATVS